jgi:hypothetical protein
VPAGCGTDEEGCSAVAKSVVVKAEVGVNEDVDLGCERLEMGLEEGEGNAVVGSNS